MMRRGPLADYPIDTVLRSAARERISGSIVTEDADVNGTVYLAEGQVIAAELTGTLPDTALHGEHPARDRTIRHVVSVLAVLGSATGGWFRHDPFGAVDLEPRWRFDVDELLQSAAEPRKGMRWFSRWATRPVAVTPPADPSVPIGMDAWRVISALARPGNVLEVNQTLGWDPNRLAAALTTLEAAGILGASEQTSQEAPVDTQAPAPAGWNGSVTTTARPLAPLSRPPATLTSVGRHQAPQPSTPPPAAPPTQAPADALAATTARPPIGARFAPVAVPSVATVGAPAQAVAPSAPAGGARRHALKRLIDSLRT